METFKHDNAVLDAQFNTQGTSIYSYTENGDGYIWDVQTGGLTFRTRSTEDNKMTHADVSPDGKHVVMAYANGTVLIWQLTSPSPMVELKHKGTVWSASFSPDGRYVATVSEDGKGRLWSLNGLLDSVFDVSDSGLRSADYSPDGSKLVVVSRNGVAEILEILPEIESLQSLLWEQEADCPDGRTRSTLLGQNEAAAEHDYQVCKEQAKNQGKR